jgi:ribosomal protein S6--L-glutamate ligase
MEESMRIQSVQELKQYYHSLDQNDVFTGKVNDRHLKLPILIDLLQRGVSCIPSPISQALNGSKVFQALVYKPWMVEHTYVVTRRTDLLQVINRCYKEKMHTVVTRQDHLHCGHGIRKWESLETLYNCLAFSESDYPFVIQEFVEDFTDVRVIVAGDYREAYSRENPHGFRVNLAAGGMCHPVTVDENMERVCREVMERGQFPYAHIDLMITGNRCYFQEIALNAGIKGAVIARKTLDEKKTNIIESMSRK